MERGQLALYSRAMTMIASVKVHFGKHISPFYLIDELRNEEKGVCTLDGIFVDIVIICNHMLFTILFGDKEY